MTLREEPILPTHFSSIEEAVNILVLSRKVKWRVWNGFLCRYTKRDICPEFVVKEGMAVKINEINHDKRKRTKERELGDGSVL